MNQIYDTLPGMDARSPGAMLKNNPGGKKNNRFEELLEEHAKLGEPGNSKEKKLLDQMLAGQMCPAAWFRAFALEQSLLGLQPEQVLKTLPGGAGREPLLQGPGQIPPSQVKGADMAAQAALSGGKIPGAGESRSVVPGTGEPGAKESAAAPDRKETLRSYKESPAMLSRMPGMKAESAGIKEGNGPPGLLPPEKETNSQPGESVFSKRLKSVRPLKHEKPFTEDSASQKPHLFEQPRQNVKFSSQTAEPGRVKEPFHEAMPDMDKLSDSILKHVAQRAREFEISLHPRNLGSLLVKASYADGKTVISLVCGEAKTAHAILQNAGELADILQTRLGSPTEVVAHVPRSADYLEQQNSGHRGRGEEARQQQPPQENQDERTENGEDFLQQLRLGLI